MTPTEPNDERIATDDDREPVEPGEHLEHEGEGDDGGGADDADTGADDR